ncbi:hypothetical protein AVEN_66821-1 [Araneus ventricosus]|uniref:Uncharacterized protein n=1 Tax=Araneus ventricosus TaxID=182803 RepID=A0A4Y2DNW1_ARAVE|nr:hypothetical protein AVEN_66821-1 [Araneus ventricosus]
MEARIVKQYAFAEEDSCEINDSRITRAIMHPYSFHTRKDLMEQFIAHVIIKPSSCIGWPQVYAFKVVPRDVALCESVAAQLVLLRSRELLQLRSEQTKREREIVNGDAAMNLARSFEWHTHFKSGRRPKIHRGDPTRIAEGTWRTSRWNYRTHSRSGVSRCKETTWKLTA